MEPRTHQPSMGVLEAERKTLYDLPAMAAEIAKRQSREGVRSVGYINSTGAHSYDVPALHMPAEVLIDITQILHDELAEDGEFRGQDVSSKFARIEIGKDGHVYAVYETGGA